MTSVLSRAMPPSPAKPLPLAGLSTPPGADDLAATAFIDCDDPAVRDFAAQTAGGAADEHDAVRGLFAAVRDGIRYAPYRMPTEPGEYRASAVLASGRGYCIQKSVLLTAVARAAGIPSRLGFAVVKNHLQSERLRAAMGTDLFIWHGYSSFFVGGRWTKASAAFNRELCERVGVEPLDFDGRSDALLHAASGDGSRYMEYTHDRGAYTDLPLAAVLADFSASYPGLAD